MMKRIAFGALAATSLLATGPAAAAAHPDTQAKALEGADLDTQDGWSFRKTTLVDAMDEPAVKMVTRWDPSKPDGEQCTVVSVDVLGKAKDGAVDKEPCDEGHDREVYGDLRELLSDAKIEKLSEDDESVTYRIEPSDQKRGFRMGGLNVNVDDEDAERLVGTVEVAKTGASAPYVRRVSFKLKESAGNLVAKLRKLDVTYTYGVDEATGAKLMNGMALDLDLSLFTLLNVTTKVVTRYDEFRRLP
jgi:hypothetical protein